MEFCTTSRSDLFPRYSPTPIEIAPTKSERKPVSKIVTRSAVAVPIPVAMPSVVSTPSCTPKTASRMWRWFSRRWRSGVSGIRGACLPLVPTATVPAVDVDGERIARCRSGIFRHSHVVSLNGGVRPALRISLGAPSALLAARSQIARDDRRARTKRFDRTLRAERNRRFADRAPVQDHPMMRVADFVVRDELDDVVLDLARRFPERQPKRCATRKTCVSTASAASSKATDITTLAVFVQRLGVLRALRARSGPRRHAARRALWRPQ